MATGNNILQKLPQSAVTWLKTLAPFSDIPAANIYAGISIGREIDADDRQRGVDLPCIIADCPSAEYLHNSGNWKAQLEISVRSNFDDVSSENKHRDRFEALLNAVVTNTLATDLSAATDFTAFVAIVRGQSYQVINRSIQSAVTIEVACCGSDIS